MKPERWQQLDRLFHSALERGPAERSAFLDESCAGDESLRRQVEALLAAHDEAGSFIERPAMEVEARELADDDGATEAELQPGESVSHYRVISQLGAGGMGQVYLAQDITLGRRVALKLLPADFTRDNDRVRRFQQEARAASALNHPNIITIYEISQVDDRHFIATEFIDGQTLRGRITGSQARVAGEGGRIAGTGLKLSEVLNIATQVADALAAAHEAGIVHRDIKPENIMVRRRDGYVKVLDFGLAKLTEGPPATVDTEAPTRTRVQTSAGVVMGTASYMSPEQARGERVDSRTDIWSLGVVLYEMVAGCAPFERSTASEVIALILERQPPPLARYAREVPSELERIVSKALTKDREERYQTAKDLLIDLRRLRQRLELEIESERFGTAGPSSEAAVATNGTEAATGATTAEPSAPTDAEVVRRTSSAEYLVSEIKRHKQGTLLGLAIIALAVAGIAFGIYKFTGHQPPKSIPFQTVKISQLTTTGNASAPAISPDGKYVAYRVIANGQKSLWIRQVATASNVQLVPHAEIPGGGITFSHDGNYIYYVVTEQNEPDGALYQVPVLGGVPRRLLTNIQSPVTVSPDDKRLAFFRSNPSPREDLLMITNADGSGEQKLASRKGDNYFAYGGAPGARPAWSPDGKVIACGAETLGHGATVVAVSVADGSENAFTRREWEGVSHFAWLGDGSGLVVSAVEGENWFQIWHLTYPSGEVRRITNDFHNYLAPSLTGDSSTMVVAQWDRPTNIWVAPIGDTSHAKQITFSNEAGLQGLSWTPDGRIVYQSWRGANSDIWIMNPDGRNQEQLTVTKDNASPTVTADGRYVVFAKSGALWRMNIDGSHLKQLTNGNGASHPHCSPDSKWVVYDSADSDKLIVWKVSIDGGEPVQLTTKSSDSPGVSPDGKYIACFYGDERSGLRRHIAIIPFEGGEPIKLFDCPQGGTGVTGVKKILRWTPDGRAVTYVDNRSGVLNIWGQPVDGGPAKQLTEFETDTVFWYDWSRDGKELAVARGAYVSNIVLITDSR